MTVYTFVYTVGSIMNTITAKLYKSGNSYSVRIPMGVVKYLGLQPGEDVSIGEFRPLVHADNTTAAADDSTRPSQAVPHAALNTSKASIMAGLPIPLDALRAELHRHGVIKASLFGSYARGEARPDSDLDLLVELAPGKTYLDLGGLQYTLEQITGRRVDIATRLNKHFAPYAERDMIEVLS